MAEPIRIYLKLKEELHPEVTALSDASNEVRAKASEELIKATGADTIFRSNGIRRVSLSLGFKVKQTNPDFKKKVERIDGYYVYSPKVRTETNKILVAAEKQFNSVRGLTGIMVDKFGLPSENFIGLTL